MRTASTRGSPSGTSATSACSDHFAARQADRRSDHRQEKAFRDELPHQASAAGAQRGADGQLLPASLAAEQQQVCDVRARNQEHADRRRANRISIAGRTSPTITSAYRRTTGVKPEARSAAGAANTRTASARSSLAACSVVAPGRNRPIRSTSRRAAHPNVESGDTDAIGRQTSTPRG